MARLGRLLDGIPILGYHLLQIHLLDPVYSLPRPTGQTIFEDYFETALPQQVRCCREQKHQLSMFASYWAKLSAILSTSHESDINE